MLTACERHFGIAIPHAALVDLVDARTVAAYVDGALGAIEAAEAELAQHWSKTLPNNVNVVGFTGKHAPRNERLAEQLLEPVGGEKVWNPIRGGAPPQAGMPALARTPRSSSPRRPRAASPT